MDKEEITQQPTSNLKLFNTPIEIGFRCLIILSEIGIGNRAEIERLMYFDYLTLNTYDLGGPESIHAPIPNRGVQVYVRKEILQKGIRVLLSKELINFKPSKNGFEYAINENGLKFLEYFSSKYFIDLVQRARWVITHFNNQSTNQIKSFIDLNLQMWGSDFLSDDRMVINE